MTSPKHKLLLFLIIHLITVRVAESIQREYFVVIKEIEWDYAPSGTNLMINTSLEEDAAASVFTTRGSTRIGRTYKKAVYRQYTDESYTEESPRPQHLGILGEPLKAEVGDQMIVHLWNNATQSYSMHPHGVFYNKSHEGAWYRDNTHGNEKMDDRIPPQGRYTYVWDVKPSFAPSSEDPPCLTWAYHSHIQTAKDTNSGLIGPLIVCRKGILDDNLMRRDVDRELYIFVTVFDENESWYLQRNIENYCSHPDAVDVGDADFQESNKMHGINGLMYGNLNGIDLCKGENAAVYALGLGTEVDLHSLHFHGQTVIVHGHRQDTLKIFPAIFTSATLNAGNPGVFQLSCSVNDHVTAGMLTNFRVRRCGKISKKRPILRGVRRKYHIEIVEEEWNYGPTGYDLTTGNPLTEMERDSATFFLRGDDRIGGVYKKAIFHQYTDARFKRRIAKPSSYGLLGPLIAAEVGDVVRVVLRNSAKSQSYNIEPHGVFYQDISAVAPGQVRRYTWTVPADVAPTSKDSDCIVNVYTSSVDPAKDTNSGLVGPILICKRGTLSQNLARPALYVLLTVFDENSSHYLADNMVNLTSSSEILGDDDFVESNLMHSMNGLMYGNLNLTACSNTETDIHLLAIGTEVDMHSFRIGGVAYKFRNEYTGVLSAFPHTTASATIKPNHVISNTAYCHVTDHLVGGMIANFKVNECGFNSDQDQSADAGLTRTYYIAVNEEIWDYSPTGLDVMHHDLSVFINWEMGKFIGSRYWKAIYQEYTDDSFSIQKSKPTHLGLLGPVISAEEGDRIEIVFKNNANRPYNIHPEGLFVVEDGGIAQPQQVITYIWEIPKEVIPRLDQPACNAGFYGSRVDLVKDAYSGLVGPVRICRKGGLLQDGHTLGSNEEFYLLFQVFDEGSSHYLDRNIREFAQADPETFDKEDEDFLESNLMHSINGRTGNLDGLEMTEGDYVIWHLLGLGNEVDIHTVHFHAHSFNYTSDYTTHSDVFNLFPGKVGTVVMTTDAVGTWLVHCHVNDHVGAGMNAVYTVASRANEE